MIPTVMTLHNTMGMTPGYSGTEEFFYLDYIKAFDTISLRDSILLEKLAVLGSDGMLLAG